MRAVVFDYFATLTDPAAEDERRDTFTATAAALGVPAEAFWAAMSGSFGERIVGVHGDTRSTLAAMAVRCGVTPSATALDAAVEVHYTGARRVQRPRPRAVETLETLRGKGFRIGLISDCSSELVENWPGNAFSAYIDAPVFSWSERRRKPDAHLYATVAARLGVAAGECWYVGDGGGHEHQGARAAGMRPVLVTNAGWPGSARHRLNADPEIP
ncbi:MAG: HAD hydrolase-like protein, partial [Catenulispora sp.]|nr:HAD hydrolase-like protein [Catenulispora sp.]